jgi:hypothetical protein
LTAGPLMRKARGVVASPTHHRIRSTKAGLVVPLVLTAVAVVGLSADLMGYGGAKLTLGKAYSKICLPLIRLLCFLAIGLLVGQVLESTGWTEKLSRRLRPLTRWAHLKDESGAAFIAGFVSGILANTLLMNFLIEEKLTRRETTLTYLLNAGLPSYLVHLPTTFFMVFSLAGAAGLIYTAIGFAAACLRSGGVLLFARLTLPPQSGPSPSAPTANELDKDKLRLISEIWKKFQSHFLRILPYTLPVYALMVLLNEWGFFLWLREGAAARVSSEVLPVESAGVVVFALAAEFSTGMAAAGALLEAGTLTVKQTVLALIVGTIVATPIRAVRHQLPTHAGLFSLALGAKLLLMSQVLRIASLILVTILYALWV